MKEAIIAVLLLILMITGSVFSANMISSICNDSLKYLDSLPEIPDAEALERTKAQIETWDGKSGLLCSFLQSENINSVRRALHGIENACLVESADEFSTCKSELFLYLTVIKNGEGVSLQNIF